MVCQNYQKCVIQSCISFSPEKKNSRQIHWHIEIYPITKSWSGLERGYGIFLNDISPEQAAEKLGAACRRNLANLVGIV